MRYYKNQLAVFATRRSKIIAYFNKYGALEASKKFGLTRQRIYAIVKKGQAE